MRWKKSIKKTTNSISRRFSSRRGVVRRLWLGEGALGGELLREPGPMPNLCGTREVGTYLSISSIGARPYLGSST